MTKAVNVDAAPGVFLFSGHMIDRPGRPRPRFPASLEASAASALARVLGELGARTGDQAISSGAAGGDILFAEACLALGLGLMMVLPFPPERFLHGSVEPSGPGWRERFQALERDPRVVLKLLPPVADGSDPYGACNDVMLQCALSHGAERLRCIVLWDGREGGGPGGAGHMAAAAEAKGVVVYRLDPAYLDEAAHGTA